MNCTSEFKELFGHPRVAIFFGRCIRDRVRLEGAYQLALRHPTAGGLLSRSNFLRLGRRWGLEKVKHRDAKRTRKRVNHRQRRIGSARLDPTHVRPKHSHAFGELFLRDKLLTAKLFDARSELFLMAGLHAAMFV